MDTTVAAWLYDSAGNLVAQAAAQVHVPAHANIQVALADLFNLTAPLDAGQVLVRVTSGGSVYPYVSVVDDRTGDAILVPGMKQKTQ